MKHTLIDAANAPPPFSGCSAPRMPPARRGPNAAPVFVNGVEIAEAAIAQEAQNHGAGSVHEARATAARALVIRELLLQRARALRLAASPQIDSAGRLETDEEALVREVLERGVVAAEPTDAECRRVYASSPGRFQTPELYEASHILIAPEGDGGDAWTEAHARATALIASLSDGAAAFEDLARGFSACPTARQGGSLGQLRPGDLATEIEGVLSTLAEREIAALPARTRHGWHVLRLDRRLPAAPMPYDAAAPAIRSALRARAWAAAAARYVEGLTRQACIEGLSLSERAGP